MERLDLQLVAGGIVMLITVMIAVIVLAFAAGLAWRVFTFMGGA